MYKIFSLYDSLLYQNNIQYSLIFSPIIVIVIGITIFSKHYHYDSIFKNCTRILNYRNVTWDDLKISIDKKLLYKENDHRGRWLERQIKNTPKTERTP